MMPVWLHHAQQPDDYAALCRYISQRIWGKPRDFPLGTGLAVLDGGGLAAGLVYYDYDKDAGVIQISGAAETPRWLTRPVLFEMFSYPFNQMECQAVVMRVDPDDKRLERILTAYRFEKHEIPRLRGRDKNECLFILTDDAWKANGFHKDYD